MSLSRTSSSTSLEQQGTGASGRNDSSSSPKQTLQEDTSAEKSPPSGKAKQPTKAKAPFKKLAPPVVRTKLTKRERSTSSPVLIRPVPSDPVSADKHSQTSDEKIHSGHRKSKQLDSTRPSKQPKQDEDQFSFSSPKLRSKPSQFVLKPLTPEQQMTSDLADLLDKLLLRKKGRIDDEIAVSQMTVSLQRHTGKQANEKVRIDDLLMSMFSAEMKTSAAWDIARQAAVKIKSAYFFGRDTTSVVDESKEKEITEMLKFLAANLAGAFFNISGGDEKNRLPEKIRFFLQAADHRQIRVLLSTDAGIRMSHEEFTQARKDWLAKVLLDAFLIPLVLKEFFPARGTIESDKAAGYIIQSLHAAFSVSAPTYLPDSLRLPPDDIAELMVKRRAHQFRPSSTEHDDEQPALRKATSPNRQRRKELDQLFKKTIRQLAPVVLSEAILTAIRQYNETFDVSSQRIDAEQLLGAWRDIARTIDIKSPAVAGLQILLDDRIEQLNLDKSLIETDLLSKLSLIESRGQPLVPERARRLSSDLPFIAPPGSSAPAIPVASTSTSPSSSDMSHRRRPTRSPVSPPNRIVQHKRSKTADVALPDGPLLASGLTRTEREVLIKIYPDLLLECVKRAAMVKTDQGLKMNTDPVTSIITTGRLNFPIPLSSFPHALRTKILAKVASGKDATTVSHADLWKLLMLDTMIASRVGRLLLASRFKALNAVGTFPSVIESEISADQPTGNDKLTVTMRSHADSVLSEIFSQGLAHAGLPEELIAGWKDFDQKLQIWSAQDTAMQPKLLEYPQQHPAQKLSGIDVLRSALGFDLVVTRLIYNIAYGKKDANPPVAVKRYAESIQKSLKPLWDKQLFNDFKVMTIAAPGGIASHGSASSTSQTPSSTQ